MRNLKTFLTTPLRHYKILFISIFGFIITSSGMSQQTKMSSQDSLDIHYNFLVAASNGNLKKVNEYIKLGVFIDYRDAQGASALFYAVNNAHTEVVKTLLYYGANPNIGTYDNYTPLMAAATNGDFEIAKLLLYIKLTNINLADNHKLTALHYASYFGDFYIVDMLLFYNAKANSLDINLNEPLYYAALNGDTAISKLLIKNGNKVLYENKFDISPLKVAIQNNDSTLFDLYLSTINADSISKQERNSVLKYAIQLTNKYAIKRWLSYNYNYQSDFYSNPELAKYGYISEDKELIEILETHKVKTTIAPIITSLQTKISTSFNGSDYMSYLELGIRDSRFNIDVSIRYGTRFIAHSIVQHQSDNVWYQLWEQRRILGLQLRKNFLINPNMGVKIKPFFAVDIQYHWGKYKGYSPKISPNFYLVPEVGISFQTNWLTFDISYQYANYGLEETSSSKVNFGLGFMFPFYQKPIINNELWF